MKAITLQQTHQDTKSMIHRIKKLNWPLIIGALIVLLMTLIAIKGPDWSPMNPMEEHYTLRIDGKIKTPPYPAFTVPGYPLGTDGFGRDIVSRLYWAVRPTMIMVMVVAAVRLFLGIVLGLFIGWSAGRTMRALESIMSGALSIPLLIVALIGIAAVGIDRGLIAFIIGLSITGWAETARLVSEQTRMIKQQAYIEAAQALGASDLRLVFYHILRQIMPMVWMLLAFEVSSTLLITAELGFLGYYIGGGVWVELFDFNVVNVVGLPELGQMLATSLTKLTDPSALIAVGSVMFLGILGFNLVGEGLRVQLSQERMRGRVSNGRLASWFEEKISQPFFGWAEENAVRLAVASVAILAVGGGMVWMGSRPARQPVSAQALISVPGNHLWASEKHDAQGTYWAQIDGPTNPKFKILFKGDGPFAGSPAIAADGTIIVTSLSNGLMAFSPEGQVKWMTFLDVEPVGSPALGPNGEVYVTDTDGGLGAFSQGGTKLWQFTPKSSSEATSGPIVGSDGSIYYTVVDHIQAVSAQGEHLWKTYISDSYLELIPRLSPQGGMIFVKDAALAAQNGIPLKLDGLPIDPTIFTDMAYSVGANSQLYFRSGHTIYGWRNSKEGVELQSQSTWEFQTSVVFFPLESGATPDSLIWLLYSSDFGDSHLVWLDKESRLVSNHRIPDRDSHLIAIDQNSIAYVCSPKMGLGVRCRAIDQMSEDPKWEVETNEGIEISGGAMVDGVIYLTTQDGYLFSLSDL